MTELQSMLIDGRWSNIKPGLPVWGLLHLLTRLGPNITGAEIGVHVGMSSYLMLSECLNIKQLIGIDHYREYEDWNGTVTQATQDHIYGVLQENAKMMGDRFRMIKNDSTSAASEIPDGSLDFIYIDGDHSTEATYQDLVSYVPKVRTGGIIAGHDIGIVTVFEAISRWRSGPDHKGTELQRIQNNSWYWYKD